MHSDQTSPKKRNPQQQKKSRNTTKKTAQLCGKTAQLATLIHSKVERLDKHARRKQRKATPTKLVSRQVYVHALVVQHLYSQWWDKKF